ncbi:MAG: DUF3137 domain-containing protein [Aureispira sp.]|nr:DUF3137 domain-containing protein [Aureispira sp.]
MNQIIEEYQEELAPVIEKLEAFRLKQLGKTKEVRIYYFIPAILTVLAIPIYWKVNPIMAFVVFAIAVAIGVQIAMTAVSKPSENYIADFKKQFFTIVAKAAFPKISYQVDQSIALKLLVYSELFKTEPSESEGDNYFKGVTETGQKFQFSEVKAYEGGQSVFEGFFYEIEMPTNFKSKVMVLPNKGKRSPKSVASLNQLSLKGLTADGDLVAVANVYPKFEKDFMVYSHSKEMAYHVLVPSIVEGIHEIYKTWKVKPQLSFIDNKIYVGIPAKQATFAPNIHESLLDNPNFVLVIEQLTMYFEVVKCLSIKEQKTSKEVPNKTAGNNDFPELD